ncbi:MAG: response regulator transcription factor [Notoacmeibacter sp.]|nr:response regulator transcription factor [Notoacmeibacter sp.]MCC0032351.1 response regulator transcription factor [Brucellaceae bacterium]
MSSTLIYLLEDDPDIAKLITRTVSQHGFTVVSLKRMADFEREVRRKIPDLCLIDLILPDGDGLSVITHPLLPKSVPRIVVTGRGNLTDRIVGLEIGADDYIVKPFEPRELVARIRAVLRRCQPAAASADESETQPVRFGDWTADLDACTLTHRDGGVTKMSASETALLAAFIRSAGRIMSRSQLLDAICGRSEEPFDRSMDARISRLRRKLRDDPRSPQIIQTVYGSGYIFTPKPV